MKWIAGLLDRFLDWIAPVPKFDTWLADWEADCLPDDLWSAHKNSADTSPPARVGGIPTASPEPWWMPTGTDMQQPSAVSAGGSTDEQRIEELVADYREFLREVFRGR